jgi:hypothetical protein
MKTVKEPPNPKYLALKQAFDELLVDEAQNDRPGRLRRMERLLKLGRDLERAYSAPNVRGHLGDDEEEELEVEEDGEGRRRLYNVGRYGGDIADTQRQILMMAQRALEVWAAKASGVGVPALNGDAPVGILPPEDFARVLNAAVAADNKLPEPLAMPEPPPTCWTPPSVADLAAHYGAPPPPPPPPHHTNPLFNHPDNDEPTPYMPGM